MWTRPWKQLVTVVRSLWQDQCGAVLTTEVVLVGTVLGTGTLVGLSGLRDTVVHELGDLSATIAELNQAYSYAGIQGCSAATAGSHAGDLNPKGHQEPLPEDAASQHQRDRFIVIDATNENSNNIPTPQSTQPLGRLAT